MPQNVESLLGPTPRTSQLAFGSAGLARALPESVVVYDTTTWKVTTEIKAPRGVYAVGSLGDGGLVAALVDGAVAHLPAGADAATRLPSVISFKRGRTALILPGAGDRFWITSSERTPLTGYRAALSGGYLEGAGRITLKLFANHRDAAVLADGTLVVIDGNEIHTAPRAGGPAVRRLSFALEGRVLVAPAADSDKVWLAGFDGTIALVALARPDKALRSFALDGFVKEFVSGPGDRLFAAVWPDERSAGKLALVAIDGATGKESWRDRVFPAARDDMRPNDPLLQSTDLAVRLDGSKGAGHVAVGGRAQLAVWRAETGERLKLP